MRIACLFLTLSICHAEDWPQWRGPQAAAISTQSNLPTEWTAEKNIAWKTPIPGRGHSSPVVWGKRIFLTTSIEGAAIEGVKAPPHSLRGKPFIHPDSVGVDHNYALKILCLDNETGKILWERTAYDGPVYDARHRKNTYASPTPVIDGKYVYVSFESQGLYAYDFDGKQVWKARAGNIKSEGLGAGTSPVLFEDVLLLQCDQDEGPDSFLAAFSTRNGELLWKAPRKNHSGWSTPLLVQSGKQTQLIASGAETTVAYDPRTGKELWNGPGVEGNAVPSSVAGHGMVFLSAGYPTKRALAFRLEPDGAKLAWQYEKGTAYVPSPILYGDYLYLISDKGLLTCLDARTGKLIYEGKRPPVPATFSASPVAFDNKIFITSEDGETFVIQAGPEHQVLATNTIGEPVYASIAITDGALLLRGEKNLYSIRKPRSVAVQGPRIH